MGLGSYVQATATAVGVDMGNGTKRRAQQHKVDKLGHKVAELQAIVDSYSPKKFDKKYCPHFGNCVVTDCDKLSVKCYKGEERNCLECVDFMGDEKCNNWAWRNCVIARKSHELGVLWPKKYDSISKVNIRNIREKVKVV